MERKYKYVCHIVAPGKLNYCATIDPAENVLVVAGDMVFLDNGVRGIVKDVTFTDVSGAFYKIFCAFAEVNEILELYRPVWRKGDANV